MGMDSNSNTGNKSNNAPAGTNMALKTDPLNRLTGGMAGNFVSNLFAPRPISSAMLAHEAETTRQQSILKQIGGINSTFASPARQQQYSDYGDALKNYFSDQLNQQRAVSDRNLKFGLARAGQTGGSVAVDQGTLSAKDYINGVLSATGKTQDAVSALKNQDNAQRLNLINQARGGLSIGTNDMNAFFNSQGNAQNALASGRVQGLGDLFGNVAQYYTKQANDAEQKRYANQPLYG